MGKSAVFIEISDGIPYIKCTEGVAVFAVDRDEDNAASVGGFWVVDNIETLATEEIAEAAEDLYTEWKACLAEEGVPSVLTEDDVERDRESIEAFIKKIRP